MSVQRPSRLRLPLPVLTDGDTPENTVIVQLPTKNRFSISYADDRHTNRGPAYQTQRPSAGLSEGDGELHSSDDSGNDNEDRYQDVNAQDASATYQAANHNFSATPHFSRTMSMPLPSQLSQLRHPHRPPNRTVRSSPIVPSDTSPFASLSIELADTFQLIIQTMLQISPPQMLESGKEQYSACSLSVPTPSMSAMFTAMKTLNYMSANLRRFYSESAPLALNDIEPKVENVFDIGELLQGVGDTLSGVVAQAGVELVIYHGDTSLRHVHVKGDECGISYALLHIVRQAIDSALPGDLIELGLFITPHGPVRSEAPSLREEPGEGRVTASPVDLESLRCTIKIEHRYGASTTVEPHGGEQETIEGNSSIEKTRSLPQFTALLRRLLRIIDAQFTIADNVENGQIYEVSLILDKTASPTSKPPTSLSGSNTLEEPVMSNVELTIEQLLAFVETLKGRRATLYTNPAGGFAKHVNRYLNSWGMEVTHALSETNNENATEEGSSAPVPDAQSPSAPPANPATPSETTSAAQTSPKLATAAAEPQLLSFVLIDDDIGILRERLQALRIEQQPLNLNARARPSLSTINRPRSSPQLARVLGQPPQSRSPPSVILHFTSLANFKAIKDVVQSAISAYANSGLPLPEVMVIPKPVGPRRFLTAIHTAVARPAIDPFFLPTATSPSTPGLQGLGPLSPKSPPEPAPTNQVPQSTSSFNRPIRPLGSRTNSDRSTKEHVVVNMSSPSPLGMPDNVEYFSRAVEKLGSSPSSGLLVSSPDGQPAGIFFHPRAKVIKNPPIPSPPQQFNETVGTQPSEQLQRRGSIPRLFSGGEKDAISFSALHEASSTSKPEVVETSLPENASVKGKGKETSGPSSPTRQTPLADSPASDKPSLSRRSSGKRPKQDASSSSTPVKTATPGTANDKKEGKSTTNADGNIVPPISVLIVDDNPINQTILSTFMKRKKIRYGIASNGQEAVEKWRTGGFHLILMDIQMPIMDGIQATREIRRLEKLNATSGYPPMTPSSATQTPLEVSTPSSTSTRSSILSTETRSNSSPYRSSVIIVALTASSLQSDRVAALAAGCNDFLTKPVSLLWLNNKIIEWGSIKALQMWADARPESVRRMSRGQALQARAIADRLHVPANRKSPSRQTDPAGPSKPSAVSTMVTVANTNTTTVIEAPLEAPPSAEVPSVNHASVSTYRDTGTNSERSSHPPILPPSIRKRSIPNELKNGNVARETEPETAEASFRNELAGSCHAARDIPNAGDVAQTTEGINRPSFSKPVIVERVDTIQMMPGGDPELESSEEWNNKKKEKPSSKGPSSQTLEGTVPVT